MSNPGNRFDGHNTAHASAIPTCYEVDDADFVVPANRGTGAVVFVNGLAATRTITLPPIADVPFGWEVTIKDAGGNAGGPVHLMVACDGTETIDNSAPQDLNTAFSWLVVRRRGPLNAKFDSDSYAWSIVGSGP
jgi:hypothetical protein